MGSETGEELADVGRQQLRLLERCEVAAPTLDIGPADDISPTIGIVTPIDAESCSVVCGSNSLDEMAVWCGLIDADFEVHEPPELRERLRILAARLAGAAGDKTTWGTVDPRCPGSTSPR